MVDRLELLAPAKINLTLEVLRRRDDGYHEVATLMQTIGLCDRVLLERSDKISLEVTGPAAGGPPADPEQDLAYRAARALAQKAGLYSSGVRIVIEKHIPAGMGLGGGSSDAASVLRGLDRLWSAGLRTETLAALAAGLGSDVAFFLRGGTALCSGRGEVVEPLPDCPAAPLTLFLPSATIEAKTATMYAALDPSAFSDGSSTAAAAAAVRSGLVPSDLTNVFEQSLSILGSRLEDAMALCRSSGFDVHLCGSGPAFFALRPKDDLGPATHRTLKDMHISILEHRFLTRREALALLEDARG